MIDEKKLTELRQYAKAWFFKENNDGFDFGELKELFDTLEAALRVVEAAKVLSDQRFETPIGMDGAEDEYWSSLDTYLAPFRADRGGEGQVDE